MTHPTQLKPPPADLEGPGRAHWRAVLRQFEFAEHELPQLALACRQLDVAARARQRWQEEGMVLEGTRGGKQSHPCLAIERNAVLVYLRAMRGLGLKDVSQVI